MLQLPFQLARIKPARGFAYFVHIGLNIVLPLLLYVLVRIDFVSVAIVLIILSKWRIFAVRPRYWTTNIVSNGVDIMVGVALVLFMANTTVEWWQLFWAAAYGAWLLGLKLRSDVLSVSVQAMIGQLLGLAALYLKFGDTSLLSLIAGTWIVTYISARHFLTSFEEPHAALLAHVWAYFSASLAYILGHWLLFYGSVAQIIIFLTTIGYGIGALYYLDANNRLTTLVRRELLAIMCAIILIVIALSDWTGTTV